MKLTHYALENSIDFDASAVWTLVCENIGQFLTVTEDMSNQLNFRDGNWIFTDVTTKQICFLSDYFGFDLNDKKNCNLLQQKLKESAFDEEHTLATHELLSAIERYLHLLGETVDFPTDVKDVDMSAILKSVSFAEEHRNMFEKLIDYVTLLSRLTDVKLMVCVNLRSYLSHEQLRSFFKHCVQCDINLLCIESFYKTKLPNEKVLLCDEDMCEIFPQ